MKKHLLLIPCIFILASSLYAELIEFGDSFDRLSTAVKTPAFQWGRNMPENKVLSVLVIGQRHCMREAIEIKQRLKVKMASILVESPDQWILPVSRQYRDEKQVMARAEEKLSLKNHYDVIILANNSMPYDKLPIHLRRLILEHVNRGCGFIVTGTKKNFPEELNIGTSNWKKVVIPDAFLNQQRDCYGRRTRYSITERPVGKGKILRFDIDHNIKFALVTAGAKTAADYEHAIQAGLHIMYYATSNPLKKTGIKNLSDIKRDKSHNKEIYDEWNILRKQPVEDLPGGNYFCRVTSRESFSSVPFLIRNKGVFIKKLSKNGDTCKVVLSKPEIGELHCKIIDIAGRVIRKWTKKFSDSSAVNLPLETKELGIFNTLAVDLIVNRKCLSRKRLNFPGPRPVDDNDIASTYWGIRGSNIYPYRYLQRVIYENGMDCGMFFAIPESGMRVLDCIPCLPRIVWTKPKTTPSYPGNPDFRKTVRQKMEKRFKLTHKWHPQFMSLGDEPSYRYLDKSKLAMQDYIAWLKTKFKTINKLNTAWGSNYKAWNEVEKLASHEAEKKFGGNLSAGIMANLFNRKTTSDFYQFQCSIAKEIPAGPEGVWSSPEYYSIDYPRILGECGFVLSYTDKDTVMAFRDLGHKKLHAGSWLGCYIDLYSDSNLQSSTIWWTILEGANVIAWFTGDVLGNLNLQPLCGPDWQLTRPVKGPFEEIRKIKAGYGRLLRTATRLHDNILIVYPTITPEKNFAEYAHHLEQAGFQIKLITDRQLDSHGIPEGARAILVCGSKAISDKTLDRLRKFKGKIFVDDISGQLDEHGTPRQKIKQLQSMATAIVSPENIADTMRKNRIVPALNIIVTPKQSMGLFTASYKLGEMEIIAVSRQKIKDPTNIFPEKCKITFPEKAYQYDAYQGKFIDFNDRYKSEVFKNRPVLLVRLPHKIGTWQTVFPAEIKQGGMFRLKATLGNGKNYQSVSHIKLIPPDGLETRLFSWNKDIKNGQLSFAWQSAFNEQPGQWQCIIKDVATGISKTIPFLVQTSK